MILAPLRDRADAARFPARLGRALLESVEDRLVLRGRDAAAAVPHDEDDGVLVGVRRKAWVQLALLATRQGDADTAARCYEAAARLE